MISKAFLPNKVEWIVRIIVAVIILQTLRFKFLGAEESVLLFSQVSEFAFGSADYEALLRIGTGVIELIAGILLLIPATAFWGALLVAGTMIGAVKTHVFIVGINFNNDGGLLFGVGLIALIGSGTVLLNRIPTTPIVAKLVPFVGRSS